MQNKGWFLGLILCFFACRSSLHTEKSYEAEALLIESVRQLKADGYRVLAGKLPLEEQLAESWHYQREKDANGEARYFVVSVTSLGDNFEAAHLQADHLAKIQLAGLIETRIGQLVSNQMESTDGNTKMQLIAKSKNLVTTRLADLYPLLEIYREQPQGQIEVQLVMACDRRWAREITWAAISAEVTHFYTPIATSSFLLEGLKGSYKRDESLHFSVIPQSDCYFHLFVFDADGVEQIYPGIYEKTMLYRKGLKYQFPRSQWVTYQIEKGNRSTRYEQNILLVVATSEPILFSGELTVSCVMGWIRQLPEEKKQVQFYSFLTE